MAKQTKTEQDLPKKRPPGKTPEAIENYLISLAMSLVESRLLKGTASSQETTHFLKLGSSKERVEKEILEKQKDFLTAKTESLQSAKTSEKLYKDAIAAFRSYSGMGEDDYEE